jgi:hypothetical protein
MSLAKIAAKLEVKPTDDEYEAIKTTRWGNRLWCLRLHRVLGKQFYLMASEPLLKLSREHAACVCRRGRLAAA